MWVTSGGFHDYALDKNTDSDGFPQCDEQLSGDGNFSERLKCENYPGMSAPNALLSAKCPDGVMATARVPLIRRIQS